LSNVEGDDPITTGVFSSEFEGWSDGPEGAPGLDEFGTLIDVEDDYLFHEETA
jgi:hypothetical protein